MVDPASPVKAAEVKPPQPEPEEVAGANEAVKQLKVISTCLNDYMQTPDGPLAKKKGWTKVTDLIPFVGGVGYQRGSISAAELNDFIKKLDQVKDIAKFAPLALIDEALAQVAIAQKYVLSISSFSKDQAALKEPWKTQSDELLALKGNLDDQAGYLKIARKESETRIKKAERAAQEAQKKADDEAAEKAKKDAEAAAEKAKATAAQINPQAPIPLKIAPPQPAQTAPGVTASSVAPATTTTPSTTATPSTTTTQGPQGPQQK